MKEQAINREILRLAGPSILANITVPLVGVVDMAVVGHLGGRTAGLLGDGPVSHSASGLAGPLGVGAASLMGGIAIGTMLFDLLYWSFGFLRVTTGGLTAQAYGRWHSGGCTAPAYECADNLSRSVVTALVSALLLIAVQWVFVDLAFLFVKCSDEVQALARQYFSIRIWAAPATLSLMAFKGWFIGMQDSVSAMAVDLTVNLLNIAASILLTIGVGEWQGLGYPGVAYGTLIAQYGGLLCALFLLLRRYRSSVAAVLRIKGVFSGPLMRRMFSMNNNIFIRSLCFIAVYIGFTVISARYGDNLLASCSILMKLLMIFSYFIDGFAYAGEAMTGKYIGLGDRTSLRKSIRWNFVWCAGIAVAFMFIYAFGGNLMVRLMTSDTAVIDCSRQFIPWLLLMPVAGCAAFAWDGIFIGATRSVDIREAMLQSVLAFFVVWFAGCALIGPSASPEAHIHILLAAYFAHLLARSLHLSLKSRDLTA